MRAVVVSILVGLFIGVLLATLIAYRVSVQPQTRLLKTATADSLQDYLLERPASTDERTER
jgi:uncharacterized membrane protein affecting hemolysin expression